MGGQKDIFAAFLTELDLPDPESILERFSRYLELLAEINARVNLVSRATPLEDYWTKHFLDSLMLLKCMDLSGMNVLDFGSGGGFPGLPLMLAGVDCRMALLDSIAKKANALREMVRALDVHACEVVCSRLEDHQPPAKGRYDFVLCRAVKMEQRYAGPLARLLKPSGRVLYYKSATHEDLDAYAPQILLDAQTGWGKRILLSVSRQSLIKG